MFFLKKTYGKAIIRKCFYEKFFLFCPNLTLGVAIKVNSGRWCNAIEKSGCNTKNPILRRKNIFYLKSFKSAFVNAFSLLPTFTLAQRLS